MWLLAALACGWPGPPERTAGASPPHRHTRIAVLADPQLTDRTSYRALSAGPLLEVCARGARPRRSLLLLLLLTRRTRTRGVPGTAAAASAGCWRVSGGRGLSFICAAARPARGRSRTSAS